MKATKINLLLSTLILSFSATALESDYQQPINVSSMSQHAKMKTNTVTFQDDVLLTQGSIKITADNLIIIRGKLPNHEVMTAIGQPATFYQTQDDGKPFSAQAESISYDIASGKITLTGKAQIKQLDSQINGSKIIYFLNSKELTVNTEEGTDERVKTVFLPAQFEKDNNSEKDKSTETNQQKTEE